VTVEAPAPPGDDRQRMLAVAVLLRDLLSLDTRAAAERAAVPGPLLLLLTRAFGTIDLPPLSFEGFCQALSKFGSPAPAASRQRLWAPPTAAAIRRLPVAASPATPASVPERRRQDARAAALRRELRLLDRELFEAHARRSRARGVPLALAVAIWVLAIPAGAAVMWGAVDLLDGTAYPVQAREMDAPLATPAQPRLREELPDESLMCLAQKSRAVAFRQKSCGAFWKAFECAQRIVNRLRARVEIGNLCEPISLECL